MTIRIYRSSDASAPTLNGLAGSLISVLDACLVSGYGAQVSLGYTKEYSGINKAAYKRPVGAGIQPFLLRVDDSASGLGAGKEALVKSYEVMTDVDSGSGIAPPPALLPSGQVWSKSTTADSTTRSWTLIGDEKTFYFLAHTAYGSVPIFDFTGWGDFNTYVAADTYNVVLGGRPTQNTQLQRSSLLGVTTGNLLTSTAIAPNSIFNAGSGYPGVNSVQRDLSGFDNGKFALTTNGNIHVASSIATPPECGYGVTIIYTNNIHLGNYPNRITKDIEFGLFYIFDDAFKQNRGYLRGLYGPKHNSESLGYHFTAYQTYEMSDGETYYYIPSTGGSTTLAVSGCFVKITGTW